MIKQPLARRGRTRGPFGFWFRHRLRPIAGLRLRDRRALPERWLEACFEPWLGEHQEHDAPVAECNLGRSFVPRRGCAMRAVGESSESARQLRGYAPRHVAPFSKGDAEGERPAAVASCTTVQPRRSRSARTSELAIWKGLREVLMVVALLAPPAALDAITASSRRDPQSKFPFQSVHDADLRRWNLASRAAYCSSARRRRQANGCGRASARVPRNPCPRAFPLLRRVQRHAPNVAVVDVLLDPFSEDREAHAGDAKLEGVVFGSGGTSEVSRTGDFPAGGLHKNSDGSRPVVSSHSTQNRTVSWRRIP